MDRRAFLRRSVWRRRWMAATQLTLVRKAEAADAPKDDKARKVEVKRTVCGHCSVAAPSTPWSKRRVGPARTGVRFTINLGAHCAKGAALREHGHGDSG